MRHRLRHKFCCHAHTGGKYSVEQQLMRDVVKGNVHIRPVAKSNETINVYIQMEVTQIIVVRKKNCFSIDLTYIVWKNGPNKWALSGIYDFMRWAIQFFQGGGRTSEEKGVIMHFLGSPQKKRIVKYKKKPTIKKNNFPVVSTKKIIFSGGLIFPSKEKKDNLHMHGLSTENFWKSWKDQIG